ncbi:hypothetical protein JOC37_002622 [Desulfohalotomaculum tongense]|uniref:hypothetical protein n=1 Tax=Desulforadius tongensis TaxID=1216062 RepID=UPI00195ED7B3|nr:hypothetical protein [Desulforadius tongensis]MBM7856189.1 hypothetical protein [Desulforadius tongensis]
MADWITTFIMSWVIFILLVDIKRLKYTLWGGITTILLQLIVDTGADKMGIYEVSGPVKLGGTPAFFTFGIALTIGILFVQFIPINRWLKIAHIVVTATLFLGLEYLLVQRHLINYFHWNIGASWFTNIMVFIVITWLAQTLNLTKKETLF